MRYFGHVMRAHQSLEKDIMLGITAGARKKGKPRMRWMDDIKNVTGLSLNDLNHLVKNRKKWRTLVYNIVQRENGQMLNPRRRQWLTTPLRMLPSRSAMITRSLPHSTDFIIIIIIIIIMFNLFTKYA